MGAAPFGSHRPGRPSCPASRRRRFAATVAASDWNGWGNGIENTRFAKNGGLSAGDLPKLTLKWAFGYADVTSARAQPALVGNRLFIASDRGDVHALDLATGCAYWSFRAEATVRTALLVAPYRLRPAAAGWAVFFGDLKANVYAVDATSGRLVWMRKVDEHPYAAITGTLVYHDGRVFVPVQGLNEEVQGGRPQYQCCTFRGSLSALDAGTGRSSGRRTPLAERNRGVRMPRANSSGVLLAAASGRRRPSTFAAVRGLRRHRQLVCRLLRSR